MSIINEALKKTEANLKINTNKDMLSAPKRPGAKAFILYGLILLAGLALGNSIFSLLSHKVQATQTLKPNTDTIIQATIVQPAATLPSPPPQTPKPTETNFILNGIFFSDNDGYALVNNQIVRQNDYVDGAKVSSITVDTVELDNAGQAITLSTHR